MCYVLKWRKNVYLCVTWCSGKGDSTSGRGCTSGEERAKAREREGEEGGRRAEKCSLKNRAIRQQIPNYFLRPNEHAYLLDRTQLKWLQEWSCRPCSDFI